MNKNPRRRKADQPDEQSDELWELELTQSRAYLKDLVARRRQNPYIVQQHRYRKGHLEAQMVDPEHFAYRSQHDPVQICIMASGWRARLLQWLLRVPPCRFTGTDIQFWPDPELLRKRPRSLTS